MERAVIPVQKYIYFHTYRTCLTYISSRLFLRRRVTYRTASFTCPLLLVLFERINGFLKLCSQIGTVERRLVYLLSTILTIPSQAIHTALWPLLFQHHTNSILEPHRIVRSVWGQQKHVALMNVYVLELLVGGEGGIDYFQQHGAFVLVKPFCGFVDVVVCSFVGTTNYHDGYIIVIDTVVVDRRLEHVGVLCYPVRRLLAQIVEIG